MKHPIGTKVIVSSATDDTCDKNFMHKEGVIVFHDADGACGNTEDDPLHRVKFDISQFDELHISPFMKQNPNAEWIKESFWHEELTPVFTQKEGA